MSYIAVVRRFQFSLAATFASTTVYADPWGSKALGDAVTALLLTGFTLLWTLIYLVIIFTSRRSMPWYYGYTLALIVLNVYTIITAYTSNYRDKQEIFGTYFVVIVFYAFAAYAGYRNCRSGSGSS